MEMREGEKIMLWDEGIDDVMGEREGSIMWWKRRG